jgi:hypothetical protein
MLARDDIPTVLADDGEAETGRRLRISVIFAVLTLAVVGGLPDHVVRWVLVRAANHGERGIDDDPGLDIDIDGGRPRTIWFVNDPCNVDHRRSVDVEHGPC